MGRKGISGKYSDEDMKKVVLIDCDRVRHTIRSLWTIQEAERALCRSNGWIKKMFPDQAKFAPKRAVEEVISKLNVDLGPCFPDLSATIPADVYPEVQNPETNNPISVLAEAINNLANAINNKKEWRITIS